MPHDNRSLGRTLFVFVLFSLTSVPAFSQSPASGPLRVSTTNPRYFADPSGRIVYLTGTHTWCTLIDCGPTDPPSILDYSAFLDFLQSRSHNFTRMWVAENSKGGEGAYVNNWWNAPMPYPRPGPGTALDGKPKFNLNQFNQSFFDRLRSRVQAAGQRGIYVSIMLFDGWSIHSKMPNHNPWPGHPFHRSNNINSIDGDPNNDGQGNEIETLSVPSAVTQFQEAYVRKVIDTVNDLDNVLYEISNEAPGDSQAWQYHMINLVKSYEATKGKQHPVGITVEYPNGSNADLYASPADWISPNGDVNNPPVGDGRKVVLLDTDHLCGICGTPAFPWRGLTRGTNPIFMDPYTAGVTTRGSDTNYDPNNPRDQGIRRGMAYARQFADRVDLSAMTPRGDLTSTGYALAKPVANAAQYLVYLPSGGSATVNLSATRQTLSVEWFNPTTGETKVDAPIAGGANRAFSAPFVGEAVLYIFAPVANSPAAQTGVRIIR